MSVLLLTSWRPFECAFGPYNEFWWLENGHVSVLFLSKLVVVHQPSARKACFYWTEPNQGTSNRVAFDNRPPLYQLRYDTPPYVCLLHMAPAMRSPHKNDELSTLKSFEPNLPIFSRSCVLAECFDI